MHYRNELATFEVSDSGIGIAPADIARILLPFERVSDGGGERAGVGLGLAITQALVHIMGGEMRIESQPGEGSRFIVRLMLSQPLSPPGELPDPEGTRFYLGRERQLLLIDDDAAHRDLLGGLLEARGFCRACRVWRRRRPGAGCTAPARPDFARCVDAGYERVGTPPQPCANATARRSES